MKRSGLAMKREKEAPRVCPFSLAVPVKRMNPQRTDHRIICGQPPAEATAKNPPPLRKIARGEGKLAVGTEGKPGKPPFRSDLLEGVMLLFGGCPAIEGDAELAVNPTPLDVSDERVVVGGAVSDADA